MANLIRNFIENESVPDAVHDKASSDLEEVVVVVLARLDAVLASRQ